MTESSTLDARWTPQRVCALAALYFLAASLFALDPILFDVLFGLDSMPDAPPLTIVAGLASIAALLGAIALASEEIGTFAGDAP